MGLPHLPHHHQAQVQTLHGPGGSTALGEQLQTYDSIRSSWTLARSGSGVAKNLGITLQLVQLEIREKHVTADDAPGRDMGPLGFVSATNAPVPCPQTQNRDNEITSSIKCFEIWE